MPNMYEALSLEVQRLLDELDRVYISPAQSVREVAFIAWLLKWNKIIGKSSKF